MRTRTRRSTLLILVASGFLAAAGYVAWRWDRSMKYAALAQAQRAFDRNEFPAALRYTFVQLEATPRDLDSALLAGRCLDRMGKPAEADTLYKMAGDVPASDLHAHALALMAKGRHDMAEATYQQILVRDPDDVLALRRLAATYLGQIRLREILPLAARLAEMPDREARVIGETLRGLAHHRISEYEPAAAAFERVLALDPDLKVMPLQPSGMFWHALGTDLIASGRAADARRYLERSLTARPDPGVLDLLGQALDAGGDMDGGERRWREAIALNPDQSGALLRLGRSLLRRGKGDEALPLLERAVTLRPKDRETTYTLQQARRRLGLDTIAVPSPSEPISLTSGRQSAPPVGPGPEPGVAP